MTLAGLPFLHSFALSALKVQCCYQKPFPDSQSYILQAASSRLLQKREFHKSFI